MEGQHVLVINPFSSPEYLASALRKLGMPCTALYTAKALACLDDLALSASPFDRTICVDSDEFEIVARHTIPEQYACILNGAEESTQLTDGLTERFFPHLSNGLETSSLRFDKYLMQEAVRQAGLPAILQTRISIPSDWNAVEQELQRVSFPVFCKPNVGYGSIGAFRADSMASLKEDFDALSAGQQQEYLVQELVSADEYLIDTFSAAGSHHVCSVFKYRKQTINDTPLYRSAELVKDHATWQRCCEYVARLLPALGFRFGFAHIEIFICADGQIRLVELNNRISGAHGTFNRMTEFNGLTSQVSALHQFLKGNRVRTPLPQSGQAESRSLFLFRFAAGRIMDPRRALDRFHSVRNVLMLRPVGESVERPARISLMDAVCIVELQAEHISDIDRDAEAIHALEARGELV
ncbi:ATP-grasp domain-containing protein [Paraburkholderia sp. RL17-373-BIF-A]|uniref:ATP-grasp domain-containing protein n=1 Tax=Paraburkholderia sp. RL17-373-BIF-A TaxID=3031629 RepID=UPI0038B8B84A